MTTLVLGGDVMLGRGVAERMAAEGPDYPLGGIAHLLRQADLAAVNLECAITGSTREWSGAEKTFYFRAPPEAAAALARAGIGLVSLANNHVLDYDAQGLRDTLRLLDEQGIAHAGAGMDQAGARAPAVVERGGLVFGMSAWSDHPRDFAARVSGPGVAYMDTANEADVLRGWREDLQAQRRLGVDWPMLSLHWGPNLVQQPSHGFVRLARAAAEMGWRTVFGHSAHIFQGIEIHRGVPLIYGAGDLVDDYLVHPWFRIDHQMLYELHIEGGALARIGLHPVFIADMRVMPADARQSEWIGRRMGELCAAMGGRVRRDGQALWIEP